MDSEKLSLKAARLGFRSEEPAPHNDANKTLAEAIQSQDQRFWEAFPVMLAAAAGAGEFSYEAADACLAEEEKKYLKLLTIVSLGLYDSLGLEFAWRKRLFGAFPARLIANFKDKFASDAVLELGKFSLQAGTLKENLSEHLRKDAAASKPDVKTSRETALDSALSRIFTARQKGLLLKRLNLEMLTKTEKEYFSRVIKKKVQALANEDLHSLARRVLE
jgi:hypothetical protein